VIGKLNKAVVDALAMPAVKERLAKIGAEPSPTTPKEFDALGRARARRRTASW